MVPSEEQNSFLSSLQQLSTLLGSMSIVDLSPLLSSNMPHWPSNPDVFIVENARTYAQHGSFAQTLILPEHTGCHVDAPAHQHAELAGQTIDTFPANALMGMAKKIDLSQEHYAPGDLVPLSEQSHRTHQCSIDDHREGRHYPLRVCVGHLSGHHPDSWFFRTFRAEFATRIRRK
jgi:arylformamidase